MAVGPFEEVASCVTGGATVAIDRLCLSFLEGGICFEQVVSAGEIFIILAWPASLRCCATEGVRDIVSMILDYYTIVAHLEWPLKVNVKSWLLTFPP